MNHNQLSIVRFFKIAILLMVLLTVSAFLFGNGCMIKRAFEAQDTGWCATVYCETIEGQPIQFEIRNVSWINSNNTHYVLQHGDMYSYFTKYSTIAIVSKKE